MTYREDGGLENVTLQVPDGYNILNSTIYADAANYSFHLTNPEGVEQWIQLNSAVTPNSGSQLKFQSRLRYSGSVQVARAQVSTNGGSAWSDVWSQSGDDTAGESAFSLKTVSLSAFAGQSILFRFRYEANGGGFFQTIDTVGWFLDEIEVVTNGVVVLSETGSTGLDNITAHVPVGYTALFNSTIYADPPAYSFHLTTPGEVDQWVQLNPSFAASSISQLSFKSRLRYSGTGQSAKAQVSNDGGETWDTVWSQAGDDTAGEGGFSLRTVSLAAYDGDAISVRFLYDIDSGGFSQTLDTVGWFVDDIQLTNVEIATPVVTTEAVSSLLFTPEAVSAYPSFEEFLQTRWV